MARIERLAGFPSAAAATPTMKRVLSSAARAHGPFNFTGPRRRQVASSEQKPRPVPLVTWGSEHERGREPDRSFHH